MGIKKSAFYLVHRDTGQRYPIKGPVIIGRTRGDIVFSSDSKLSIQHCVVEPQKRGLSVRDLRSSSGTRLNGQPLTPDRDHFMRPEDELSLGEQGFMLQAVTRSPRAKRRRSKQKSGDGIGLLLFVIAVAIIVIAWKYQPLEKVISPAAPNANQLGEVFENYQSLQMSYERHTAPAQMVIDRIEEKVLMPLNALTRRWNATNANVNPTALLSLQMRFANALQNLVKAQIAFMRTGESKYSDEVDQWADQIEPIVSELRLQPGYQFPALVQSPLQIVERELRQALREYRELGAAVATLDLSDKVMSDKIRTALIPKFIAVHTRLGAITAQNDYEKRKVGLQIQLVHAITEQLKAVTLYSASKDAKYSREMELWGNEIRRANESLKLETQSARAPASTIK